MLFDIDFDRCLTHWAAAARARGEAVDLASLRERFAHDAAFEAHERGELSCDDFFRHLAKRLGLTLEAETLRAGWNAIFGPDITGLGERLETLADHCALHVLTNTNRAHAEHYGRRYAHLLDTVESVFASHELGMRKPEPRIYDHVVRTLGVHPQDVLFLDDNLDNLASAAAGRPAHAARSGTGTNRRHARCYARGSSREGTLTGHAGDAPLQD